MANFREFTLPKTEKEVDILNNCLVILNEKGQLFDKELNQLCSEDELLNKRIKYCLIETYAAKESKNLTTRILSTENTKKYLETNYYALIYKEKIEKEERQNLELIKLKEDIRLTKKQSQLAIPAFISSIAAIIASLISLIL